MTSSPKPKRRSSAEIADLFRVLKFMSMDPNLRDGDFRIAFRIAQAVNSETGWAMIGDARLSDEIPRTDRQKLRKFRKRMQDAGWLEIKEGERGRPTLYLFLDHNVEAIEERQKANAQRRETEFHLQKIARETDLKAAALRVKCHPETGEIENEIRDEISPLDRDSEGSGILLDKGSQFTPLLPQTPTSKIPLPAQELTHGALGQRIICSDCFMWATVRNSGDGLPYCEECASDVLFFHPRPL